MPLLKHTPQDYLTVKVRNLWKNKQEEFEIHWPPAVSPEWHWFPMYHISICMWIPQSLDIYKVSHVFQISIFIVVIYEWARFLNSQRRFKPRFSCLKKCLKYHLTCPEIFYLAYGFHSGRANGLLEVLCHIFLLSMN